MPGKPDESDLHYLLTADEDDGLMPPAKSGGPLPEEQIKLIHDWIAEGAQWPDGVELKRERKTDFQKEIKPILDSLTPEQRALLKKWIKEGGEWPDENPDNPELVEKIHSAILEKTKVSEEAAMKKYTEVIPAKDGEEPVTFDLVPIRGGSFLMGSRESEKGRKKDEGPVHTVEVGPFWMGTHEVSWLEYEPFMIAGGRRNKDGSPMFPDPEMTLVDAISRPTKPYVEQTFGMGKKGRPAICMTQHSALKYCQWLSAKTGHFYRLPTEAEWEYACRAGTTTRFSFGDDEKQLSEYAWFSDNSNFAYQRIGKLKPNPWGLYDMHGNVAEWCLDQYQADAYAAWKDGVKNPWTDTKTLYPRVVRGGSWNDFPAELRSASRMSSNKGWKVQDPQGPKSIWYHTDATMVGFRVVRPLVVPSAEEMHRIWNTGIRHDGGD